ncbi:MAG: hypothetical protein GY881_10850 [Gammaproteobacteria bacterium]|jgi:hypothetical protein|nr:hypothetical protein [Gammaproteobacteria bacterium]
MSQATNYLENKIAEHVFGGSAYTAPSTLYVALFTSAPSDTGSGTEVSGGSYTRMAMAFTVSSDTASNTSNVEFPKATASWGTVTHFAIYDASSSGNMLCYGTLTASKAVASGDTLRFNAGELDITVA